MSQPLLTHSQNREIDWNCSPIHTPQPRADPSVRPKLKAKPTVTFVNPLGDTPVKQPLLGARTVDQLLANIPFMVLEDPAHSGAYYDLKDNLIHFQERVRNKGLTSVDITYVQDKLTEVYDQLPPRKDTTTSNTTEDDEMYIPMSAAAATIHSSSSDATLTGDTIRKRKTPPTTLPKPLAN